jgi:DNA polymerase-3 subunit gamma/tau
MAYTVLARRYRSQRFDEVVGQQPIAQTLKNAIKTGRIAHAYLFTGTRGIGKTTMARILAKALNCLEAKEPITDPCCKCDACTAINAGDDIDVIEIDGASNRGIDNIRQLIQNAIYRPARSRFKIYIIDEVHMLTTEAFNALLKILEEPPSHVKFIFATTEPNKVLATIQSRCQRFDFNNISPQNIAAQLQSISEKEKIKIEPDILLPIAKMANGSMRDALSLLDRLISTGIQPLTANLLEEFLGCPNSENIYNLIEKTGKSDAEGALETIDALINTGLSEMQIVNALVDFFRDIMVAKAAGKDSKALILTAEQKRRTMELAELFDIAGLVYNITSLEKLRWAIKQADSPRPLLEASILRFTLSEHFLNVDQLLSNKNNPADTNIKKNKITEKQISSQASAKSFKAESEPAKQAESADLQSIKANWSAILNTISQGLGSGTISLLTRAVPTRFENDILTITFDASAKMQKKMCESNGRADQIQAALSDYLKKEIKIKIELGDIDLSEAGRAAAGSPAQKQKENEFAGDPAVKTIITELGATITGIEEADENY